MVSGVGDAVDDQCLPVVQVCSAAAEGVTEVCQRDVGVGAQVLGQSAGRRDKRFVAARRDRQDGRQCVPTLAGQNMGRRRFGEYDVGVGAAEAERVDPRNPALDVGKRSTVSRDVELQLGQGHMPGRGLQVQVRRDVAVPDHERGLDQTGYAGPGFEVADVGLDRTDHQGALGWAAGGQDARQRPHLDRVTDRCSGAMGLHVADLSGPDSRAVQGGSDRGALGVLPGHGDAVGVPVLRHG